MAEGREGVGAFHRFFVLPNAKFLHACSEMRNAFNTSTKT